LAPTTLLDALSARATQWAKPDAEGFLSSPVVVLAGSIT